MNRNKTLSPETAGNENLPFWRKVTDADVREAISGSFLETICHALEKNYTPYAPLPMVLLQGILLMSAALTHRREDRQLSFTNESSLQPDLWGEEENDPHSPVSHQMEFDFGSDEENEEDFELAPARKSRVYIDTGLGNVPNAYVLIVAPSGAGKGLGFLQLVKKLDYTVVSNGSSLEGIKDAAMANPHVLISLQEFGSLLHRKGYKDDFKKGLTDMFNAGSFTDVLSARKSNELRTLDWFYPSVYASIQPEVLNAGGRSLDIAQGLFSRFLIGYISEQEAEYDFNPCNSDLMRDLQTVQTGLCQIATMSGVVKSPNPHYNTDFSRPIRAIIDKQMLPVLLRYANEYLIRIALMLAIPSDISYTSELPELNEEHLKRSTVVLHRTLTMAEAALGSLTNLEGRSRLQEENLKGMARLLAGLSARHDDITITDISRRSSGTGWDAKTRIGLLNEMIQRGWIDVRHPTIDGVEKVVKGCTIKLNKGSIPSGIL